MIMYLSFSLGKWFKKFFIITCIYLCILPINSFAGIDLISLLPNPIWDDTLGEYIEIRNTGCEMIDIAWYGLSDASNKIYIFPDSSIILSHESRELPYSLTKIALNNSGNESITLTNSSGIIVDAYEYSGIQKDWVILQISSTDTICENPSPVDTGSTGENTGTTSTGGYFSGWTESGSSDSWNSGSSVANSGSMNFENNSHDNTNTGTNSSSWGVDSSASGNIDQSGSSIYAGSTSTGTESSSGSNSWSWISNTGTTATGILFPDIFPTIQFPTNAVLSWSIFDCTSQSPCRINLTFDPIFTGWFLSSQYLCEIITNTGILTTCNPNTLYFSSWEILSVRLTSKNSTILTKIVSWEIVFHSTSSSSWSESIQSGSMNTVDSGSLDSSWSLTWGILSQIDFPEILPVFQNYTNTSHSGDTLICTASPCRVNLTLDPIFTGSFRSADFTCQITYGTELYDTCNPPQLYLLWTGAIEIKLTHKKTWLIKTKVFEIIQSIIVQNQWNYSNLTTDVTPPILILEYDGKLKAYHEIAWDLEINCYTMTCSINLTAEKSYDPGGWEIRFLWYYWPNDIKTTRDPGERKYGIWDHQIWLRVIDMSGNMSEARYNIHVLGEIEKQVKETLIKEKKSKPSSIKSQKTKIVKKKISKIKKITFFDPPNIVLQNSKFELKENNYICYTASKHCNLNLTLTGSQKWIMYTWIYDNGDIVISKNPQSKALVLGNHTIRLIAGYSTDVPLWIKDINATVIKIKTPKKPKKTKKPKIVQMSWSILPQKSTKIPINVGVISMKNENTIPFAAMAFIGGIIPLVLLRKKIAQLISKI